MPMVSSMYAYAHDAYVHDAYVRDAYAYDAYVHDAYGERHATLLRVQVRASRVKVMVRARARVGGGL